MNIKPGMLYMVDKGINATMIYTFEELPKMYFPKEDRYEELMRLANQARRKGYHKARYLLSKTARKYYAN